MKKSQRGSKLLRKPASLYEPIRLYVRAEHTKNKNLNYKLNQKSFKVRALLIPKQTSSLQKSIEEEISPLIEQFLIRKTIILAINQTI